MRLVCECPRKKSSASRLLLAVLVLCLKRPCRSFLRALHFVKSAQYINTARVDPALLYVDNLRLRVKDSKALAMCIMSGTVTESYLLNSCEAGPRHAPYQVHKVSIAPLEQDMRRDVSLWGLMFDFHIISGLMSPLGFGFATRGEGRGDSWRNGWFSILPCYPALNVASGSAPSSPAKHKSSVLKPVSSPLLALTGESAFSASQSFDDPGEFVTYICQSVRS